MLSLAELERVAQAITARYAGLRLDKVAAHGPAGIVLAFYGRAAASAGTGPEVEGPAATRAPPEIDGPLAAGIALNALGPRVKRRLVLDAAPGRAHAGEPAASPAALDDAAEGAAGAEPPGADRTPSVRTPSVLAPSVPASAVSGAPPAFVQYLRAHVVGARCSGAVILGNDRQLALRLATRAGERTLLLSLLGPRSNLWLLDAEGRVESWLRSLEESRREMTRGTAWRHPEPGAPRRGDDRFAARSDDALLAAIAAHYTEREASEGRADLARRCATALERELRGLARREEKLREERSRAAVAGDLARQGELLKGSLAAVPARAREIELADPATGERVRIELDPRLTPAGNLERLFREHRRAKKQRERAEADLATLAARRDALEEQRARVSALEGDASAGLERLEALAGEPPLRDLLRRSARQAPPRERPQPAAKGPLAALPASLRPRVYRSADGLEIWVGRSDEGNDHLSTRLARGHDLFLHVDGGAGSHVLLRLAGRDHAPQGSLLDACELAVHFSKQRGAPAASVLVAPAKDVRKPRGARPGLVEVRGGRVVRLRREPERLARLLAAREDDAPT